MFFKIHNLLSLFYFFSLFLNAACKLNLKYKQPFLLNRLIPATILLSIALEVNSEAYYKSKSGVEYVDVRVGDGKEVQFGDRVIFDCKGRLGSF